MGTFVPFRGYFCPISHFVGTFVPFRGYFCPISWVLLSHFVGTFVPFRGFMRYLTNYFVYNAWYGQKRKTLEGAGAQSLDRSQAENDSGGTVGMGVVLG